MSDKYKKRICTLFFGALSGFINGLFGGGGGMVIVPTFTDLLKRKRKSAQSTAMLVILPLSLISAFLYSTFGYVDFTAMIPTVIGTVVGGVLGAVFLKKTSDGLLFSIFYIVMFFAGVKMLF